MKFVTIFHSPIGKILLFEENEALCKVTFQKNKPIDDFSEEMNFKETPLLLNVRKQLENYFLGKLRKFDLPLNPQGTLFQQKAWSALLTIPYGETISYKEQAMKVGGANYARAVGMANNKNPLPIIIPCHRVIAADGGLRGYASGLGVKRRLLRLEGINC